MKVRAVLCCARLCCVLLRWGATEPAAAAASIPSVEGLPSRWLFVCAGWLSAGKMIDNPTVLQARNVLALAERLDHVS